MYNPELDGVDHINVYSKAKTELGRFLSNFAYSPFTCEDGHFDSVEGYWYWLSSKDERLRKLSGFKAKQLGREIGAKDWVDTEEFKDKIKKAILIKLTNNPKLGEQFRKYKNLPLTHYYNYQGKVVDVPKAQWILEIIENYRSKTLF